MTIARASLSSILAQFPQTSSLPQGAERLLEDTPADIIAALTQRLEETSGERVAVRELLPEFGAACAQDWSTRAFLNAMILKAALEGESLKTSRRKGFCNEGAQELAAHLVLTGDLTMSPGSELVIAGDLTIKEGRLLMGEGARLVVLGDVVIENDWMDETQWSSACITGSLHIQCALFTAGDLHVGKDLISPFIHAACSSNTLKVLGGISAKMLIDDEHKGSAVFGQSDVAFAIVEELQGLDLHADDVNLQNLRDVLLFPELVGAEVVDFFEMTEKLIEMVEDKQPIFSGDAPGWIFAARA